MKRAIKVVLVLIVLLYTAAFAGILRGTGQSPGIIDTGVPASYSTGGFGQALEMEANEDPNTVMYCAIDHADGTTSKPQCAISGHRHKGIGPFTDADYLSHDENTFRYAGDFLTCQIIEPITLPGAGTTGTLISVTSAGIDGYSTVINPDGSVTFTTYDAGPSSTAAQTAAGAVALGQKSLVCWGREGGVQAVMVNGATTTKAGAKIVASSEIVMVGRLSWPAGQFFNGRIYELLTAPVAASGVALTAMWAAASTCRSAGRCLPTLTGETRYLGDDYLTGAPGTYWCSTTTCASPPALSTNGQLTAVESRYNWPALAWAMTGTVPRSSGSAVYPKGFGATRTWLGGFDGSNELVYSSPIDADQFIWCADVRRVDRRTTGDAGVTKDTLISNTNDSSEGWKITSVNGSVWTFEWYDLGGVLRSVASTVVDEPSQGERRVCVGHDGAAGWIAVSGGAPASATFSLDPWNAGAPVIGGANTTVVYPGAVAEQMLTTTKPTTAYLNQILNAPCTGGGTCLPRDASTIMLCNARDYSPTNKVLGCEINTIGGTWGNGGTLTVSRAQSAPAVETRDGDGAGPFSVANVFTLGTGNDVLDFPADFSCCEVFNPTTAAYAGMYSNGLSTEGIQMFAGTGGELGRWTVRSYGAGGLDSAKTTNTVTLGGMNIACGGRSATQVLAKLNGSTLATDALDNASAAGTNKVAKLGQYDDDSSLFHNGAMHEFWCSTSTPSDALFTKIQRRFFGMQGDRGQPITVTRTTTIDTTHSAGKVLVMTPGNLRVNSPRQIVASPVSVTNATGTTDYTRQVIPASKMISGAVTNWDETVGAMVASNVTVIQNNALAPDGTMTAWTVRETAVVGFHKVVLPAINCSSAADYTTSIYVRPIGFTETYPYIFMYANSATGTFDTNSLYLRIVGPTAGGLTAAASTNHTNILTVAETLADGWYRLGITGRCKAGQTDNNIAFSMTNLASVLGDVNRGIDIWAPQFERAKSFVGPYCTTVGGGGTWPPTSSVTCNADVVTVTNPLRPNGSDWTNLLLQSEDLGTTWAPTVNPGTMTVTKNVALAPDLSFTADLITVSAVDAAGEYGVLRQNPVTGSAAGPVAGNVWAKAGTIDKIWLFAYDGAYRILKLCNLSTAEWTNCSDTGTATAAWYIDVGNIYTQTNTATAAGTYYLWGAQATATTTVQSYCPTTTAARTCGPGGATGKVSTNRLIQGTTLEDAAWTKAATVTVTDADATCPVDENGNRGTLVTSGTVGNGVAQDAALSPTRSTYLAYPSGGAACAVTWSDFAKAGTIDLTLSATPVRFATYVSGYTGINVFRKAGGCGSWCQSSSQLESTPEAGPYCDSTVCAPKQRWCVRAKDVTPMNGRAWNAVIARIWTGGKIASATGTSLGMWAHTDGNLYFATSGSVGWAEFNRVYYTHSFTRGSTHTLIGCANDGVLTFNVDGVNVATTGSAVGTSGIVNSVIQAWPATLTIGGDPDAVYEFDGTIGSIDFNTTGRPEDFQ